MAEGEGSNHVIILVLFVFLFVVNSSTQLLVRYSQGILEEDYIKTAAVFVTELMKLGLAIVLIIVGRVRSGKGHIMKHFWVLVRDSYVLMPSAIIYLVLNYLLYFSLSHITAIYFAVLYQLKIFASAFMTILILRRKISIQRWVSLIMLFFGVVLVKITELRRAANSGNDDEVVSDWIGFAATFVMAICSGLGGVYFELVLKDRKTDDLGLWERNFQLYLPSCFFTLGSVFVIDFNTVVTKGMFSGFTYVTFCCAFAWALAGLVTSLVLKYGSSVLNGFGSAVSVIATAIGSMMLQGFEFNIPFFLGSIVVVISVALYQVPCGQLKESIFSLTGTYGGDDEEMLKDVEKLVEKDLEGGAKAANSDDDFDAEVVELEEKNDSDPIVIMDDIDTEDEDVVNDV